VTGPMATQTEFCLLGPLVVRCGGALVPVQPGKQRAALAALLLDAGRVVSVDELAETLWGSQPPPSARVTVQNYMMRLRKALACTGHARIATQPGGYLISLDSGELDVSRFEVLLEAARTAARDGSWDAAAGQARGALTLWRGEPLADLGSELLARREGPRLAEMRMQAVELRIDADLHLGRHGDVIGELRRLAAGEPLRERLHALLMLALYRDGRPSEALASYQRARQILAEELGTEPGTELRELHQRILTEDPALAIPGARRLTAGDPGPAVPRQLPATVAHFTGREGELAALTGRLDQAGDQTPGTVVISAIGGMAGVGKTALAVRWAHQVAQRFPDGQLYVNLRGYDPGQPMPAAEALAGFLRVLGVPGQDIPEDEGERAARYRSLLAGRRVLVVLDNAGSVQQVRPLLPGTPACAALVTSRDSLASLVARDGAVRLDLDVLSPGEAVGLLATLIGERVAADPGAAAALAAQCSRLPLALRVAAEFAAARPAVCLADLVSELADQQRRLDVLGSDGDPRTAVRAVFSWSYRHLGSDAARAFRLASLHPGPDLDPYAAAALTGSTVGRARHLLDTLARAHLIQAARPGRYGMHDLLRAYARELAGAQHGAQDRRAALTRVFDYYLHATAAAMDTLVPAERHRRPSVPSSATPAPPLAGPEAARAWLDAQRATLVAVAAHTASEGWPGHATRLATILFRYLKVGGHYPEGRAIHTSALHAARHSGDRAAQADASRSLGVLDAWQGRYQSAADQLGQALVIFREIDDLAGEARTLGYLGIVDWWQGHYPQAAGQIRRALAIFRAIGDQFGEAGALNNLSIVLEKQGHYQQAADCLQQALAISREIGHRDDEAHALDNLGVVERMQGHYQQAADHHQQALALFREISHPSSEAHALDNLGAVERLQGHYQQAADHHQQALTRFGEIGDRCGEAQALNGIGETLNAAGRAHTPHATALSLASQIGNTPQQARAHNGLARAHNATGDPGQARSHWQQALTLYTELGAPEAAQVRAQLASAALAASQSRAGPAQ